MRKTLDKPNTIQYYIFRSVGDELAQAEKDQ